MSIHDTYHKKTLAKTYKAIDGIGSLEPESQKSMRGDTILEWFTPDIAIPSDSAIAAEVTRLNNAEPMRVLRLERDRLLTETDYWASSDLTMSNDRKTYRQALRDLPASADPKLDSDNYLTNVTWPTKPS